MKLVAEQIKELRERRKELQDKKLEYIQFCQTRENGGVDGFGAPHFLDYQEDYSMNSAQQELREIDHLLEEGEFLFERPLQEIGIGTKFMLDFGDGELDQTMLVEKGTGNVRGNIYASLESDLGKAVMGHKVGDVITYKVSATGREITVTIAEIEALRENYEHFIKEEPYTDRISDVVVKELKKLKEEDEEEYRRQHMISPSQEKLLVEEFNKIPTRSHTPKHVSQRGHIRKILHDCPVAPYPTGDEIQIGSYVEVMLQDGDEEPIMKSGEMINRAVSTEIASDYIERITPLGRAIFGLKAGDTFQVRRNHKPCLKGAVVTVTNYDEKERVK